MLLDPAPWLLQPDPNVEAHSRFARTGRNPSSDVEGVESVKCTGFCGVMTEATDKRQDVYNSQFCGEPRRLRG